MLINLLFVIVGLIVLVWSADKFIDGAAATAAHFGMSPLLVGMLIVGFGTSAPEMVVSAFAAIDGNPGIALGNAYGSNIANIGLVLGVAALLYPMSVGSRIVRREIPILILVMALSFGLFFDELISRVESIAMLIAMFVLLIYSSFYGNKNDELAHALDEQEDEEYQADEPLSKSLMWLFIGLVLLLLSSHFLVQGTVGIAEYFGVSDLVIGLTVVAIGTSLPELAATVAAAKKGESDIALGNIIGSCLFNALAVVGIAGVIRPIHLPEIFLSRDFVAASILTLLLWLFAFGIKKTAVISRWQGGVLLAGYFAYTGYLLLTINQ